ncbi:isochorismatase family protein [Candidatus Woesearchaeota archaeon]|nr:isochorismatase family protein [Candidatus Woesearchaeota archaeon]MBT7367119.1 isochorismatase family protein [Candidatus Woesearchaeota archaeon]
MRIFCDIDTQNDLMNKDGAFYVPGAENIKQSAHQLTKYAYSNSIQILGSVIKNFHKSTDPTDKSNSEKIEHSTNYCIDQTKGELKIGETTFRAFARENNQRYCDRGTYISSQSNLKLKTTKDILKLRRWNAYINYTLKSIKRTDQIRYPSYVEREHFDVFSNPAMEFLLIGDRLIDEAVVYGVSTDYSIKTAVAGMQKLGIQCYVVEDAIRGFAEETSLKAIAEMKKLGAKFVNLEQILNNN